MNTDNFVHYLMDDPLDNTYQGHVFCDKDVNEVTTRIKRVTCPLCLEVIHKLRKEGKDFMSNPSIQKDKN